MSFLKVAIAGSAVVGYAASRNATKAASAAAEQSNQTMRDAAQLQYDLGRETLDFNKQYYNEVVKPAADFDMQTRREMTPLLKRSFEEQEAFARQQRQDYLDNWRPVEQRVRDDAMGYDSDANVNRRMGIAAAGVNQQFSNAQQQGARALTRFGLNPNSSAFARANANLINQQALASAGMQTGAAFDTMDRGIALRAGAANFGRNMPNTSIAVGQLGNQTAGTTAGMTAGGVSTAGAAGNFMNQGYGLASNMIGAGANIDNSIFNNNVRLGMMQSQGIGQLFQGIGQGIGMWGRSGGFGIPASPSGFMRSTNPSASLFNDTGMYGADPAFIIPGSFADGGPVEEAVQAGPAGVWAVTPPHPINMARGGLVSGPGGPRDDMVPAMLSPGEFVLNEGAARHFGEDKLNKMNAIGLENQARRGLIGRA
jgi:hypothetical protein